MNNDILKGSWNQLKGNIQKEWGQLTHSELDQVEGDYNRLVGLLQEKYGHSIEEARSKVSDLIDRYDDLSYKGEWNEVKGDIQKAWGKLTNSDVDKINGSKTRLLGVIQQRYARSRIDALKEVDQFLKS